MVSRQETAFLNFFRGLAALWVAAAHCMIWNGAGVSDLLEPKKAVSLFMVISGFLMVYTIDKAALRENPFTWPTWRKFYQRRFFRIAPAYYVSFVAAAMLAGSVDAGIASLQAMDPAHWKVVTLHVARPGDFGPANIALHVTFLFGLFPTYSSSSNLPDWSLSLEMQFYAVFPLLYMAIRRYPTLAVSLAVAAGCFAFVHLYTIITAHGAIEPYREPSLLLLNLPWFLVGMLIHEAGVRKRGAALAVAAVVMLLASRGYGPSAALLDIIVCSLAALWAFGTPAALGRLFASRPTSFLSDASYSVYLFHGFVIALLGPAILALPIPRATAQMLMTAAVLAVAYAVAWGIWRLVEMPMNEIGRVVSGSKVRAAPPMA